MKSLQVSELTSQRLSHSFPPYIIQYKSSFLVIESSFFNLPEVFVLRYRDFPYRDASGRAWSLSAPSRSGKKIRSPFLAIAYSGFLLHNASMKMIQMTRAR